MCLNFGQRATTGSLFPTTEVTELQQRQLAMVGREGREGQQVSPLPPNATGTDKSKAAEDVTSTPVPPQQDAHTDGNERAVPTPPSAEKGSWWSATLRYLAPSRATTFPGTPGDHSPTPDDHSPTPDDHSPTPDDHSQTRNDQIARDGYEGKQSKGTSMPSSTSRPSLESQLSSTQLQLLELQAQVKKLQATLRKASDTPFTEDCKSPMIASASRESPVVEKHTQPVPTPQLSRLKAAWTAYHSHGHNVVKKSHEIRILSSPVRKPSWGKEHALSPPLALAMLWRRYQSVDREIWKTAPDILFARSTGHEPSIVRPRKGVEQGTSQVAKREHASDKEKSKQMIDTVAPTRAPSRAERSGIDHDATISSPLNNEMKEHSLFEELFPEATSPPPSTTVVEKKQDPYPKLELPDAHQRIPLNVPRRQLSGERRNGSSKQRARFVESFLQNKKVENITVLQLAYCSTELTESDFLRLIPKGKHIEGWRREGEFFKVIPGRDPLSLERMPFYYLLFNNPEASLAYQNNVARLHKLSALHQPSSILSAIPAPKGFLEDGEDISKATSSYNLAPSQHQLHLSTIMQPYNPALRALIERGGYHPIVPNVDEYGQHIWKVLMHIEGYEPTPLDLFRSFTDDAWRHGMQLPLRTESVGSIHRVRDIINLKTTNKPISSVQPRAYGTTDHTKFAERTMFEDPAIQFGLAGIEEQNGTKELNQYVMNRVYNRWVIDFNDENAARRFAINWHRKVLPPVSSSKGAWEETEELRMCNTEVLW
ncbi:predicted protein [Plenodomus lingam JN3]|uniref:Predicted protein n=1 Tax=Leptosphaeria maculans (strain JN3 / isolate v23.1.3 / race Av1-4-5-6-7-8) TaxID=985895 RepID=E5A7Z7_LEPMJ|nr:predicted protein [Plenodomus lingam JN3]CBX99742.1 predicted protein [Plenodomus lingam JN3]